MKYMHFNSSCSYAGMANMLKLLDYDTEDYKIALDMGLPFFARCEMGKYYQPGAMLQSKEWFNLYLKPRGFCYIEKTIYKHEVIGNLRPGIMLGINVNQQSKHAIVFIKEVNGVYIFLNNKWEESLDEESFEFTKDEFLKRIPEKVVVGYIEKCNVEKLEVIPYYKESINTWRQLKEEINQFTLREQSIHKLQESMNRLFRPLLVDGLAMMKLLEKQELVESLEKLQGNFLNAVKKNKQITLAKEFDCSKFDIVIDKIIDLIENKMNTLELTH